jgi:hypothetical protein
LPGVRKMAFSLPADSPTELRGDATRSNSPSTDYDVGFVEGTIASLGNSSGVVRHWPFVAETGVAGFGSKFWRSRRWPGVCALPTIHSAKYGAAARRIRKQSFAHAVRQPLRQPKNGCEEPGTPRRALTARMVSSSSSDRSRPNSSRSTLA